MEWLKTPPEVPIESKAVSRSIRSAQTQVEQQNFEIRKDVLKYDDVLNRQRKVIYGERREVLEGADLHEQVRQMIDEVVTAYVTGATEDGFPEEWDLDQLWTAFRELYHPTLTIGDVEEEAGGDRAGLSRDFLVEVITEDAQKAYDHREEELTPEVMRELERRVVLSVLDRKWREHLYEMDYLREGIGLRAMAQRDPLVEYQREGYDLFNNMMEGIKEESVGNLFNLQVEVQENPIVEDAAAAAPLGLSVAPPGQQIAPAATGGPAADNAPGNGAPRGRHAARGGQTGRGRGAQADAQPGGAQAAGRGNQAGGRGNQAGGRGNQAGGRGNQAGGRGAQAGGRGAQSAGPDDAQSASGTPSVVAPGLSRPQRPSRLSYSAPSTDGGGQVERRTESAGDAKFAKVGRNAPCPCGSGRKYKLCHGDPRNRADA
jgi:preprotein translocase subunit SecA